MLLLRHARRAERVVLCLAVVIFLLYSFDLLKPPARRYDTWAWTTCPGSSIFQKECYIPRAETARDTQIVLRTGATEPLFRLRSHLETVLSHIPIQDVLIFSDTEGVIGSYYVHDAFAEMSKYERAQYPVFALYDEMRQHKQQGGDPRELEALGWTMAKYAMLALKRRIWNLQHDHDHDRLAHKGWFVFIETDTYVAWDNLFGLLEHLDPTKKLYIGSPAWEPGVPFAHGGTGYVLSYAALEALNEPSDSPSDDKQSPFYSQYGVNVTALSCGDEAVARALKPRGVTLTGYWPLFNGETPSSLAFGHDLWCEPVITLHHVKGEVLKNLGQWVEKWKVRTNNTRPLLFKDLFDHVAPHFTRDRAADWDNIDDDWKIHPHRWVTYETFEECQRVCDADRLCFQFVFYGTKCAISRHIRVGGKRLPAENGAVKYQSGWNLDRIQEWTLKTSCASAHWLRSNP